MLELVSGTSIESEFDLSLEVTHHGPWINVPSIFVEVGSTAETWGHRGAAEVLANLIAKGLGMNDDKEFGKWDANLNSGETVVVTLGGSI